MKTKNYYFLIAGFFAFLFAITHELNGQYTVFPTLDSEYIDTQTSITFRFIYHIITGENIVIGLMLLIMSFTRKADVRLVAWLICSILAIRLFVIVGTTLAIQKTFPNDLFIDIIAILIYISLIMVGTIKKHISHHPA